MDRLPEDTSVQGVYAQDEPAGVAAAWSHHQSEMPESGRSPEAASGRYAVHRSRQTPAPRDDGTIAPWTVAASRPFAPDIVLPSIEYFIRDLKLKANNPYGFKATFNATYPAKTGNRCGWVPPWHYGLNQGPLVLMIENFRSELLWRLTRGSPYIVNGLRRAGFDGGWLQEPSHAYRS